MATIFMLADPFPGESKAKGYEGKVDIDSMSMGVTQAYRVEQQGGGAQASASDIVCTKMQDSSSPLIEQWCMNGETIPEVQIHVTKQIKDSPILIYKITIANVVVSSYSVSVHGTDIHESFSLNYASVLKEYVPVDEKGKKGGAVSSGYDFVAQAPNV